VRDDLDRGLAVAGTALGVRQSQREGDRFFEGHQTSGGWLSLGSLVAREMRRGGGGAAGGPAMRLAPWSARRPPASRPPRPKASAVATAAEPRISPNAM